MRNDSDEQLICPKHNLKSIYTKLDKKSLTQIFACFQCIQEENKTIPNKINKMEKYKMNSILCQLFSIKSAIKKHIGSLIDDIRKKIYFTDELIKDLKTSNVQKVYLQQQNYKYQQSLTNFQRIAVEQIANIKQIHALIRFKELKL